MGGRAEEGGRKGEGEMLVEVVVLVEMLVEEVMRRKNGLDYAHLNEQVLKRDLGGTSM